MSAAVKICGLTSREAVDATAAADFAGFVFYPRSPRNLAPEAAAQLASGLPRHVRRVAVLVDPDDALLQTLLARFRPDLLQLHGSETPARTAAIRQSFGLPVIKAVAVRDADDVDRARAYQDIADWLMFDAKPPRADALPGGNATSFDWALLAGRSWRRPWFLSGGLGPDNVVGAIARTRPDAVDVSSGVELHPGRKDPVRIAAFIGAVRGDSVPGTRSSAAR